jgi:hypothetical protein
MFLIAFLAAALAVDPCAAAGRTITLRRTLPRMHAIAVCVLIPHTRNHLFSFISFFFFVFRRGSERGGDGALTIYFIFIYSFLSQSNGVAVGDMLHLGAAPDVPLVNMNDTEYYGDFTLGTPAQTFTAVFDTGSAVTWVGARPCACVASSRSHVDFFFFSFFF